MFAVANEVYGFQHPFGHSAIRTHLVGCGLGLRKLTVSAPFRAFGDSDEDTWLLDKEQLNAFQHP